MIFHLHLSAELGLKPGERAEITLSVNPGKEGHTFVYTPIDSSKPVRIMAGGEVGSNEVLKQFNSDMIHLEGRPLDAVLISGNAAYCFNLESCTQTIQTTLDFLPIKRELDGVTHLIPFIIAPGDGELGVQPDAQGYFDLKNPKKQKYSSWYPQRSINGRVPGIDEQQSYHAHFLGDIQIISLDSNYMTSVEDQIPFLRRELKKPARVRLAAFHVPMKPALVLETAAMREASEKMNDSWGPLFGQHLHGVHEGAEYIMKRAKA